MQQRHIWGQDKKKKDFSFRFWTYVHYQNDIVRTKNYKYATQMPLKKLTKAALKVNT